MSTKSLVLLKHTTCVPVGLVGVEVLELSCECLLVDLEPLVVHLELSHLLDDAREKDGLLVSVP